MTKMLKLRPLSGAVAAFIVASVMSGCGPGDTKTVAPPVASASPTAADLAAKAAEQGAADEAALAEVAAREAAAAKRATEAAAARRARAEAAAAKKSSAKAATAKKSRARASAAAAADGDLTPFVGTWAQHAGGLHIRSDGSGTLTWQDFTIRSDGGPSFPELTLHVTAHGARSANAVVRTSDTPSFRVGDSIKLTRTTIGLDIAGKEGQGSWCDGPHFSSGDCGA
jgi:hypothetical protein